MKVLFSVLFAMLLAGCFYNCTQNPPAQAQTALPQKSVVDPVKRGEYLVGIMGCNDCHSPKIMTDKGPAPDPARLLSGHPADMPLPKIAGKEAVLKGEYAVFSPMLTAGIGPWGASFAANLTPDETGIGSWSFEQFKKALTEGKYKGMDSGRPLLPPMPWVNYVNMSEGDLQAVFAYLKSLPPVKNLVPAPVPPTDL